MSLDYHFTVEQEVGSATHAFFGFNGMCMPSPLFLLIMNFHFYFLAKVVDLFEQTHSIK